MKVAPQPRRHTHRGRCTQIGEAMNNRWQWRTLRGWRYSTSDAITKHWSGGCSAQYVCNLLQRRARVRVG